MLALALAVTLTASPLIGPDALQRERAQHVLDVQEFERVTRIQTFVAVFVALAFGGLIGWGVACIPFWTAPHGRPVGFCPRL